MWEGWLGDRFIIGVPNARAVNPVTRTNGEGAGVQPDVRVPASEALAAVQQLLRRRPQPH